VTASAELNPAATDDAVLSLARSEQRVLLTEDKDFGLLA
jgi:predicted nuclease of predicted toxin-antitoxin system